MNKARIYVGLAHNTDPNAQREILHELSKYNVEVVQYEGPGYGQKQIDALLSCHAIISVPPKRCISHDEGYVECSRGLYQESERMDKAGKLCYIYDYENLEVYSTDEYEIIDEKEFKGNYGDISFNIYGCEVTEMVHDLIADLGFPSGDDTTDDKPSSGPDAVDEFFA